MSNKSKKLEDHKWIMAPRSYGVECWNRKRKRWVLHHAGLTYQEALGFGTWYATSPPDGTLGVRLVKMTWTVVKEW